MSISAVNRFVGAIDQGTSSTKFVIYDHAGSCVGMHQLEHRQHYPQRGWVEHDPEEIWDNTQKCIVKALEKARLSPGDLEAVGVTNQRESTVVWNRCVRIRAFHDHIAAVGVPWGFKRQIDSTAPLLLRPTPCHLPPSPPARISPPLPPVLTPGGLSPSRALAGGHRTTGKPYYNVIVWNDVRTRDICEELKARGGPDRFRDRTGLPINPYFSASKIMWILDNVPGVRDAAERGEAVFGNIDSWLAYKLSGG
jgi:glycerol kinase